MKIYFGENLRYLRKKKAWKLNEIELYTKIKRTTWNTYELGKSYPNFLELIRISKMFGCTETEIIHFDLSNNEYKTHEQPPLTAAEPRAIYDKTPDILEEIKKINERLENLEKARPNKKRNSA